MPCRWGAGGAGDLAWPPRILQAEALLGCWDDSNQVDEGLKQTQEIEGGVMKAGSHDIGGSSHGSPHKPEPGVCTQRLFLLISRNSLLVESTGSPQLDSQSGSMASIMGC